MQITTVQFKSSRSQLLRTALLTHRFIAVWCLLAMLIIAGLTLSIVADWRWALVTAMVILVLAPGVMALLYIDCMFSPRTLPGAYPHTVCFTDDAIEVKATVPPLPDEAPGQEPKKLAYTAAYTEVAKLRLRLNDMAIIIKGSPPGIILVPYDKLPDPKADVDLIIKCVNFATQESVPNA